MPKIVINEYDLTKAGTGEYSNFSVVVPGFLAEDKYVEVEHKDGYKTWELSNEAKAVFDENGIYECTSQNDFVNNVGKRAAAFTTSYAIKDAVAPTVSLQIVYDPNQVADYTCEIVDSIKIFTYNSHDTFAHVMNAVANGVLPTYEEDEDGKVISDKTDFVPEFTEVEDGDATPGYSMYHAISNTNGIIGELKTDKLQFIEAKLKDMGTILMPDVTAAKDSQTLELRSYAAPTSNVYYVINDDVIGENGEYVEDRIQHYGNQMAYELLGLGYTVLFKAMTEYHIDELKNIVKDEDATETKTEETGSYTVVVPEKSAVSKYLTDSNFWECLKDKSTYDFRYLVTGLLSHNDEANTCILEVADHSEEILLDDASITDGRGDCIALIDLDCAAYAGKTQAEAIQPMAKEAAKWSSAYAACFAPYVTYLMADDDEYENNKTFPASFHYLACAANSANNNFKEWYANAGYTRGVSKYTIESTGCKLGEIAIQSLEPRFLLNVGKELNEAGTAYNDVNTSVAINLIVKIKSSYYLWGNRTGKKLGTRGAADGDLVAQHFLNIRQLCTTIKKQIYVTCRRLTFDPNSNVLWINFRDLLTPMLEQMKADQGIKDYKIVKNATDRKALLSAKIRIVPIEAVEDFEIGLYLEDSLEDVALTEA